MNDGWNVLTSINWTSQASTIQCKIYYKWLKGFVPRTRAVPLSTSSYNMINSPADREEWNHGLEMGSSLRAPDLCLARLLEIQRCHSEVTKHAHAHRSITSNSLGTQLMVKGPFKVAHLSPPPPISHNALFMAPLFRYKTSLCQQLLAGPPGINSLRARTQPEPSPAFAPHSVPRRPETRSCRQRSAQTPH